MFRNLLNGLCNLLYPTLCIACEGGTDAGPFCTGCSAKILRLSGPGCSICGIPFVSEAATSHSPDHYCGTCREKPPAFSKAHTPFSYDGPIGTAICKFKYEKKPHLAASLAKLFVEAIAPLPRFADRVMAIPLHPDRLRDREFNPSLLLAKKIADSLSLPCSIDALTRIRDTPPQVGLSKKEREQNIKGAFQVVRSNDVEGQRILLVDDVYTTGSTLREGAKTLMKSGAKEVIVVALARMLPGHT